MTRLILKLFVGDKYKNDRARYGTVAGITGICCNIVLAVIKVITGMMTGAVSIASDAINNMSDAVSSIVTLVGFRISGKPADHEHPYGHGRAEYLAGFIVSAAVMAIALNLFKESIQNIIHPKELDVSIVTVVILILSILVKLWMSFFYGHIGKEIKSSAMMATAMDSRNDCITTFVALLSVLIMMFFNVNIDGYAGAIVSIFVMIAGFESAKETVEPMIGKAPDPELIEGLKKIAEGYDKILGVHDIRVHEYGPGKTIASFHVEIPYNLSLIDAHELIDEIEHDLVGRKIVSEITIHMDPVRVDDEEMIETRKHLSSFLKEIDERISIHDFRMIHGKDKDRFIFEVLVPYDVKLSDSKIIDMLNSKLSERNRESINDIIVDRE